MHLGGACAGSDAEPCAKNVLKHLAPPTLAREQFMRGDRKENLQRSYIDARAQSGPSDLTAIQLQYTLHATSTLAPKRSPMAKALVLSLPAHGHVNPTLPLVRELVSRGDQVIRRVTFSPVPRPLTSGLSSSALCSLAPKPARFPGSRSNKSMWSMSR